jgi:hypothetical protein
MTLASPLPGLLGIAADAQASAAIAYQLAVQALARGDAGLAAIYQREQAKAHAMAAEALAILDARKARRDFCPEF